MPLAVLGVLPIIWNTIRSFWIRHYLAFLIPAKARKNVSLTIDPTSGVVIVVLDKLGLRWQDILRGRRQQNSLAPRRVQQIGSGLVGCSWMGLVEADVTVSKMGLGTHRVMVDASLRFEPPGIVCDRQALLFLALGLGVDPYRDQLKGVPEGTPADTEGEVVMSFTSTTDGSVAQLLPGLPFSERRALAWFCIMMVRKKRGVSYNLLSLSGNFGDLEDFAKPSMWLEELDRSGVTIESALRWTSYAEAVYYDEGNHELLPVPQPLLKAKEDCLAKLKSLSTNNLEDHLLKIFNNDSDTMIMVFGMLERAWHDMVPQIKSSKRKGQENELPRTAIHGCTLDDIVERAVLFRTSTMRSNAVKAHIETATYFMTVLGIQLRLQRISG